MIYVDYNTLGDEGLVYGRIDGIDLPPLGGVVRTGDHEGNRCKGTLERVVGRLAYVKPDLDTWEDGPHGD